MMSKTAIKEYNTEEIFNFANGCIKGLKPEFLNKIIDNKEHISITIPKCINGIPVKVIGDRAFIAITNLVEFKLAEDSLVETIENEVFFNCFNLASVDINRPSLCNIGARFMTFRKNRDLMEPVVKELDLRNTSLKHMALSQQMVDIY